MITKKKAVIGSFTHRIDAENVLSELRHAGYRHSDISVLMKHEHSPEGISDTTTTGIITGSTIGALAGLVAGIASITVPGVGPVLAVGPLATALGLTGVGAATGALTGGVISALIDIGLSEDEAQSYEKIIHQGGVVIAVLSGPGESTDLKQLFKDNNATDTHNITHNDLDNLTHTHLHIYEEDNDDSSDQSPPEKTPIDRRSGYSRTGMYAKKRAS